MINMRQTGLLINDTRASHNDALQILPIFWDEVWDFIWESPVETERKAALKIMRETIGRLHEAGVKIHAGSDTMMPYVAPGAALHGELFELVNGRFECRGSVDAGNRHCR